METVMKIRRWVLVDGQSQREVSKRTGISRNTIAKYLAMDEGPRYRRTSEPRSLRLFDYEVMLRELHDADLARPRRERRTIKGLYDALVCAGYTGSYDTVCRYIKRLKPQGSSGETRGFIPLEFDPGDALQFDWSQEVVVLGGIEQTVRVAHFRLSHSRKPFIVAYLREAQEMVLDAFVQALGFYDGVPRRVIVDNARTMVVHIGRGKDRAFHPRFLALMNHYAMEPVACTPASGWEKGQIENQVKVLRNELFKPKLCFATLADLNTHLRLRCEALGSKSHPEAREHTVDAVFADEKEHLRPLGRGFDGYTERQVRVSSTCLVRLDTNHYSVPCAYANSRISLRAYADRIVLTNGSEVIGTHERSFERHRMVFNPWHYLALLNKKPGALRDGAPFRNWDLPRPLQMIRAHLARQPQGDRDFVELLMLYQEHGHEAVEMACALAVEYKTFQLSAIIALLHGLIEPSRMEIAAEGACYPHLQLPPQANCLRYEQLLTSREVSA